MPTATQRPNERIWRRRSSGLRPSSTALLGSSAACDMKISITFVPRAPPESSDAFNSSDFISPVRTEILGLESRRAGKYNENRIHPTNKHGRIVNEERTPVFIGKVPMERLRKDYDSDKEIGQSFNCYMSENNSSYTGDNCRIQNMAQFHLNCKTLSYRGQIILYGRIVGFRNWKMHMGCY